jgi:ribosomal protein S18 acetylase RimI-like enzyme
MSNGMDASAFRFRVGTPHDADSIAALATLVFLDTYAPAGLRPDLAREVFSQYGATAFARRLAHEQTTFLLVEAESHLVAFAEVTRDAPCPAADCRSVTEVVRLYVHPRFQRLGLGKALLRRAESLGAAEGVWLTVWDGNRSALDFYARQGFRRVGTHEHVIEGKGYKNYVLVSASGP